MAKKNDSDIWKHIEKINDELGSVEVKLAGIKTDVSWLKKFFWIIATSSLGGMAIALINLVAGK